MPALYTAVFIDFCKIDSSRGRSTSTLSIVERWYVAKSCSQVELSGWSATVSGTTIDLGIFASAARAISPAAVCLQSIESYKFRFRVLGHDSAVDSIHVTNTISGVTAMRRYKSEFRRELTQCTIVHIILFMALEWDPAKATANLRKHGVRFADAESVLEDLQAITSIDSGYEEERLVTIGMDALGRVLVVVYTHRGDNVRVISVRKATMFERKFYEE